MKNTSHCNAMYDYFLGASKSTRAKISFLCRNMRADVKVEDIHRQANRRTSVWNVLRK